MAAVRLTGKAGPPVLCLKDCLSPAPAPFADGTLFRTLLLLRPSLRPSVMHRSPKNSSAENATSSGTFTRLALNRMSKYRGSHGPRVCVRGEEVGVPCCLGERR